ncbi:GAF domain-containing protein [Paraburkholderia terrae]|jgi:GAF domain-containing protein|uniref:Diguanylate cyclase n=1 Tax=Paraburkholderia terrae TaxID=311230 RepID=A0A2I8EPE0_9BURK|nr:GAF domain-containing protein [Paraburkholderia terrae]AUT61455.1 GAF domain-containing protein [Paraburkholderia terrae]BCZ80497.1 diguanylate cyclase [Paraburkholderia terrae]BDC41034.1 diguanylate cyclase [Paraburkholderia terrae]
MFEATINTALPKAEFYQELASQARSLLEGEANQIANAANLSALLFNTLPELNWAGFYFAIEGELVVGPFQGKPACVRIPMGRGVCGRAAETRETQVVPDVDAFPGHIACDSASRSEIVIPLQKATGELVGVLDIDSPVLARFDDEDRRGLEEVARIFVASLN